MNNTLIQLIPKEGAEIVLVLFLSFLVGLEREEQKVISEQYRFGGVRTFPLLGLLGYSLCLFSDANFVLPAVGFAVVGAFLWQSYKHKLEGVVLAGMTTEVSGLMVYVIGALVAHGEYWTATTLTVLGVVLLELKVGLEDLTKRVAAEEILTFTKFLLLTAVILPIVPNRTFGTFGFNPFKMWLVVVAVSAISYGSYLLQAWAKGHGGVLTGGIAGGSVFLHPRHRGARQTRSRTVASASIFRGDARGFGHDVSAFARAPRNLQSSAAPSFGYVVPAAGRGLASVRMALDAEAG